VKKVKCLSLSTLVLSVSAFVGCGGSASTSSPAPAPPAAQPPASAAAVPPSASATPSNATTYTKIEKESGWETCTKPCAGGRGIAISSKVDNQLSPSTDGSSSKFNLGGHTAFSNVLWWRSINHSTTATHFAYDLWFYVDRPDLPEALEFDVNQSFDGVRYTFGTECSFKDTHKWDVWDSRNGKWVPSSVPCTEFSGNTWHHLVWQFERVNNQAHFVSVTIDGQTSPVDMFMNPQTNWRGGDVDVAFQMDGDLHQSPFNVWLDQVTLTQW
jgi:hypothetical protein